jgi:hypothetical protein
MKHAGSERSKCLFLDGVIGSLRADVEAGYLRSHTELIHGELFADFLKMAQHLLDQGYKDAAAVIAGTSLEAHLRQLCQKAEVDTITDTGSPKKADRLNSELAAANVYSKLDQKNVTAGSTSETKRLTPFMISIRGSRSHYPSRASEISSPATPHRQCRLSSD